MTTINFNINDDKGSSGEQFAQASLPMPSMQVENMAVGDENTPSPHSFDQEGFSAAANGEAPQPQSFENLQASDSNFAPSPMQVDSAISSGTEEGTNPTPMDFEALNDKEPKKKTRASSSKSTKK